MIRDCGTEDFDAILDVVNEAAEACRAFIPPAEWKAPYMPAEELRQELAAGVCFAGWQEAEGLVGVMACSPLARSR